jgi:hypothetical protein
MDVALLPVRSLFRSENGVSTAPNANGCKLALIKSGRGGISVEKSVFSGGSTACESRIVELLHDREHIVVEGLPLEDVSRLCFLHNYRWRFNLGSGGNIRFVMEPAANPIPSLLDLEKSTHDAR